MDIARFAIEKSVITWMIMLGCLFGGWYGFETLGRYEDPEFTIKDALVITPYPGATASEVEKEVTDHLETAIQQMGQLEKITSKSKPGVSEITVTILPSFDKSSLPQVWDELRRKVGDAQHSLPPGVHTSKVIDDFGDVFGIYYALTGPGFSSRELYEVAKTIRKELLLVAGVAKVDFKGEQQERVFVEMSRSKLANQGLSPGVLINTLQSHNLISPAGGVRSGDNYIRIRPKQGFNTINEIADLLVGTGQDGRLLRLGDVAQVRRGYQEIPEQIIRFNGQEAITIGVSGLSGVNIVALGKRIDERLFEIQSETPIGMELNSIYQQPQLVAKSVNGFVSNLAASVGIVIGVLLIFMGLRAGFLIGVTLLLTVLGTLFFMKIFHIDMQRISLGALIIAMGMLVDNAIVVAEGILIRVQQGMNRTLAASEVVKQNQWPLLGATIVGILAFSGIGLSDDATGEFVGSLFYVILISLILSWVLAITIGPYLCEKLLRAPDKNSIANDPYDAYLYNAYRGVLKKALRFRWLTVGLMITMLVAAVIGFGLVKQSFFPNSSTPLFLISFERIQGTDIRATDEDIQELEKRVLAIDGVNSVSSFVGAGAARFMLVYLPHLPKASFAQLVVGVDDFQKMDNIIDQVKSIADDFPQAQTRFERIRLGPGSEGKIQARFNGDDPVVLRDLAKQAETIMIANGVINVRQNWRQREKIIRPVYSESMAREAGVSRKDLSTAIQTAFSGTQVGTYREKDTLIPIVMRYPDTQRLNPESIVDVQVWSNQLGKTIPIRQVTSGFLVETEEALIMRRNRKKTITAIGDPAIGLTADSVFKKVQPQIEAIELPPGYSLQWGGEHEDATKAQAGIAVQLPLGFLAMIIVVVLLFGTVRQPLVIWLTVPLSLIGVTFGLLIADRSFGFMALLGVLSLSGMLIKNAIVLVDQIDLEIKEGKTPIQAVLDSSVSRLRPVVMASGTTVLGMLPLLGDAFFVDMAVTIMGGLLFATILTMVVVPVLYAIFFQIYPTKDNLGEMA
ncbi:MAG: efflux RND transporter permease subunit [Magnetococcales bacterium]|nr:efflux RND transporter permease subunit [Magnetococcales bacterium]